MPQEGQSNSVNRRTANSGNVGYSDPVILHETSRTRITLVPFYIQHSDHTELSIKLTTYTKTGQLDWQVREDKTLSLKEQSARKLLQSLQQHLAVASEHSDGNYLLIRMNDDNTDIGENDPTQVASALTRVLSQPDIMEHLNQVELSDELVNSLRSSIRLKEIQSAVISLRESLDAGVSSEQVYQEWCENHSWAFGNTYVANDEIRNISTSDNLDLLLPNVIAGYRDIVELKRPDMAVLNYDSSHRNHYWTSDVSKAIGQSHRYLDVLQEVAANGLRDNPEIVAYHPRAIIVIGRSNDWEPEKIRALHGLNYRLANITVMTYDQLLAQGERLLEIINTNEEECVVDSFSFDDFDLQ